MTEGRLHDAAIGRLQGRDGSTIGPEIQRHGEREHYRAERADATAREQVRRLRMWRMATHLVLQSVVTTGLPQQWSAQEISRALVIKYPDDPTMRILPKTIYASLYLQARAY